jgi:DNA-directed RNA polymerase specialized sigma24 family protein
MARFQTTRWSVVLEAREGTIAARGALEELCRTYRAPILAYIRGRGWRAEEVEDLGQSFMASFIENALHAQADPIRGTFRSFLLTALKHFLSDERERANTQKRGGNVQFQSLESSDEFDSEAYRLSDGDTPERAFERAWAHATLRAAMGRLQAETSAAGKADLFQQLCEFLIERPTDADYSRVAAALDMRRNTVAVAVHRLRLRLRALVDEELADTAADLSGYRDELEVLGKSLAVIVPPA